MTLRKCSIEYKKALHDFKRKKYNDSLVKYEKYIKTLNSIDWNSYNELAMCYFNLAIQKQNVGDQEYKKYYKKSISYLNKIIKRKPNDKEYSENLDTVKAWWKNI